MPCTDKGKGREPIPPFAASATLPTESLCDPSALRADAANVRVQTRLRYGANDRVERFLVCKQRTPIAAHRRNTMHSLVIAGAFLMMVVSPCLVAMRSGAAPDQETE